MFSWCHAKKLEKSSPLFIGVIKRYASQSYYDILKVPQTCSSKDVRDAFIALSKKNHPDKHGNDPSMNERFVRINEAYSVLINPSKRRAYDVTLGSKRKLNAPHEVYPSRNSYETYSQSKNRTSSSYSSSSSSGSGTSEDYFYSSWEKRKTTADNDDSYYGIKGVKKMSNSKIVLIIIGFALVGATIEWFAIRSYSKKVREKMMENSHKLALIHSMAREKARLYGNEYQIHVLKDTLKSSYDVQPDEVVADPLESIIDDENDSGKCKKCNKL